MTSFAQITSDPALQAALQATYGSVDKIDPWVGGLCEDHLPGAAVGPFFAAVSRTSSPARATATGSGTRTASSATPSWRMIRGTTLASLIEQNTDITGLPANIFTQGTPASAPGPAGSSGSTTEVRTYDGSGNNPGDPEPGPGRLATCYGTSRAPTPTAISEPSGADRPNPQGDQQRHRCPDPDDRPTQTA